MKPYKLMKRLETEPVSVVCSDATSAGCYEFLAGISMALNPVNFTNLGKVPGYHLDGSETHDQLHASDGFNFQEFKTLLRGIVRGTMSAKDISAAAERASMVEWNDWYRRILMNEVPCTVADFNNAVVGTEYAVPVPYQVAKTVDELPNGTHYVEPLLGGRVIVIFDVDQKTVMLYRDGRCNAQYSDVVRFLEPMIDQIPASVVFDGAIVSRTFKNLMNFKATDPHHLALFDVIPLQNYRDGNCDISLEDRHEVLSQLTGMFQHFTNGRAYTVPKKLVDFGTANGVDEYIAFAKRHNAIIKPKDSVFSVKETDWMVYTHRQTTKQSAPAVTPITVRNSSTMDSNEIYRIIDGIANTSSKNGKEDLVKKFASDDEFKRVLEYAYNPFKTYGIAQRPNGVVSSSGVFDDNTWDFLDRLISRRLTGNDARDALVAELSRLDSESAELLWRIIKKDLRAGFSESTINKSIKGLIPDFPYMRCCLNKDTKLENYRWKDGVFSQEKADGMFANVNHEIGGLVTITSRQGSPFPMDEFTSLVSAVHQRLKEGTQSHGELLVVRDDKILPREQSNGILNSVLKGGSFGLNETPIYMIWDQIPLSAVVTKGKYDVSYIDRYADLVAQVGGNDNHIQMIPTRIVHSLNEALEHYREMLSQGKEGTIIKNPIAIWRDGTSKDQCKMKLEVDVDLEIVGFLPGEGKNASTFGSIVTRSSDGLLEVAVSGYKDADRVAIWKDKDNIIGRIMSVRANAVMVPQKDGGLHSLFLPRCVEIRDPSDKDTADSLDQIKKQFESAVK